MNSDPPIIQKDMIIIRNKRIELAQAAGKSEKQTSALVNPFACTARGYLISDEGQLVLAFNPRTINILTLVDTIVDLDLPIEPLEYWVLVDDNVDDCGEVYDNWQLVYQANEDAQKAHQFEKLEYAHLLTAAIQKAMAAKSLIGVGFDENTPAPISCPPPNPPLHSLSSLTAEGFFSRS